MRNRDQLWSFIQEVGFRTHPLEFFHERGALELRAVVDDRDLAELNGGRPDRSAMLAWAISASLAGLAGILLIGLGLLALAGNMGLFALIRWDLFWPLALVAAGAALT